MSPQANNILSGNFRNKTVNIPPRPVTEKPILTAEQIAQQSTNQPTQPNQPEIEKPQPEQPTNTSPNVEVKSSAEKEKQKQDKSQSFYALPPSVRKTQMSKGVVSSIFDDDDLFSSSPTPAKKPTKKPSVQPKTFTAVGRSPSAADDLFGNSTDSVFGPSTPLNNVKSNELVDSTDSVGSIPEPEPLPSNIFNQIEEKKQETPQVQQPTTNIQDPLQNQKYPEISQTQQIEIKTQTQTTNTVVEKPPVVQNTIPPKNEQPPAVKSQPQAVKPTQPSSASVDVNSLPSPFAQDLFIPPRDGGVGESPKTRLMQEKLFFRYVNAYLGQRGISINAFNPDFLNGVFFIMLIEAVTHTPLPDAITSKCKIDPKSRDDYYLNFHYAIQHLKDIGKGLPQVSLKG